MTVHLDEILATIRQRESGGNYGAKAPKSSASGAYQFIDSTWQGLLKKYGLTGPPSARDATPALQDYVAGRYVAEILSTHNGDLRAVPAVWYTGSYDPANLDRVPSPEAGNNLSVRSYVDHWLEALRANSDGMQSPTDPVLVDVTDRPAAGGPTPLDTFLSAATAQQGDRYVFGHEVSADDVDPDTFDCSELVQWAAARAGVEITDGSWLQYRALANKGAEMSVEDALRTPGALLFTFSSDPSVGGRPSRAHVAISLGDGRVMEARNPRVGVLISDASTHRWTHAAAIPELGTEQSAGFPATDPLPEAPAQFGLDSDADGLLDEHERFIGTDPFAADTDLDGFVDAAELSKGTDPLDTADNVLTRGGDGSAPYVPALSAASTLSLPGRDPSGSTLPPVELPPPTMPPPTVPPPTPPTVPPPAPPSTAPAAAAPSAPSDPETAPPSSAPPDPEPSPSPSPGGTDGVPSPESTDGVPSPESTDGVPSPGGTDAVSGPAPDVEVLRRQIELLQSSGAIDSETWFGLVSATADSNPDLAVYLDGLGIDSPDELYRLPTDFSLGDWI